MSLSVRTRFEVFKRDRFTCSYCGKTPPHVLLEVDHVIPKAAGGTDEITNLTTSCQDCNRGKSAGLLEEGTAPVVGEAAVADLRERLEQAQAYTELIAAQQALMEKQRQMVADAWAKGFSATVEERDDATYWVLPDGGQFPNMRSVRVFLRRLPVHEILAAVEVASSRFDQASFDACRYFYSICWRRIRGEGGPIDGPRQPVDDSDLHAELAHAHEDALDAQIRLGRALDEVGELRDQITDLNITVRRLKEQAGRE